eukprot:298044-Amphidinium_carterae.1
MILKGERSCTSADLLSAMWCLDLSLAEYARGSCEQRGELCHQSSLLHEFLPVTNEHCATAKYMAPFKKACSHHEPCKDLKVSLHLYVCTCGALKAVSFHV